MVHYLSGALIKISSSRVQASVREKISTQMDKDYFVVQIPSGEN